MQRLERSLCRREESPTESLIPQITGAVVKKVRSLLQAQLLLSCTTPPGNDGTSISNQSLLSSSTSFQKSAPSAVGTSLPPVTISRKSTMPAPSEPGAPKSSTVIDKRKRNESVSTNPGSAREDDLSVIDSSAESNEELSTGKNENRMAIG
ncbi:hypothetical protein ILUMI_10151 [Ignelater luminosus]|uniref:Uncharacterized protein n=1 Tax=Ignelater luminosus TaxID=2038154 RepID=A0A8K0G8Z1_IGNLU|nr:hypothetical protein ILUMI_10151 [Ignelater luminosus]